jgi:hypothetical protein
MPQVSAQSVRTSDPPPQEKQMTPDSPASAQDKLEPPRFAQLTMEQLNDQQKALAQEMLKVSSAGLGGP